MKHRAKTLIRKRQWLRPHRSPGPDSTMTHMLQMRLYSGGEERDHFLLHGRANKKRKVPPSFSIDGDLSFRDCSNYVNFDLSCYKFRHFDKNRAVLLKIRDACTDLIDALDEAERECRKHMGVK